MVTVGRLKMEPEFKEGEIVIVNPHVEAKSEDYVIAKNDKEESTFKRLREKRVSKYKDIELKKGVKYRIVGNVAKKETMY